MPQSAFLQTKFLVPRKNPGWLTRPRLLKQLDDNASKRMILVSAPAGYGKTTLLSDFANSEEINFAWYQLDAMDNDPSVFLGYLVETFRRTLQVDNTQKSMPFGSATLALLENLEEEQVGYQHILIVLINELLEIIGNHWALVLDDYHLITNLAVHQMVDYLLENAPPDLLFIISSRVTPPLRLAHLRARGMLAELRSEDLRFTSQEIEAWFRIQTTEISDKSLQLLDEKTHGWAAALQIVLSSIKRQDIESTEQFIAGISGAHRFIYDYLAEEVFRRLPSDWQEFLLATSVLEKMNDEICNALLNREDSSEILEDLERSNLCLTNTTKHSKWFYYHQLLREFLLGKLHHERPEYLLELENKAGKWFETHAEWDLSFSHYILAHQQEYAARVLERFARDFVEHGRVEVIHSYLSELDEDNLRTHPELLLQHGNVLRRLGEADPAIDNYENARWVFERYGNRAGICRALTRLAEINYFRGHYRRARELATEALQQATIEDHAERSRALMSLAKSVGFLVGMDAGHSLAEQAVEEARQAGNLVSPTIKANLLQSLGQICWWHGDPQGAIHHCEEALQVISDHLSPIAAKAYITLVSPYLYWCDLEKALQYAEQGLDITQTLHLVELMPSAYAVLGNVLTRMGEKVRAENSLRQAVELAQRLGIASYERFMATGYLAYNLARQKRLDEARQFVENTLWSYTGNLDTYDVYVCQSVLADIALEKNNLSEAENLYRALIQTGVKHQFRIPLAMVYFGLAYIYLVGDRKQEGLDYAIKSLNLIEKTRTFQLYLDQGERSQVVCQALLESGYESTFIRRVLDNLQKERGTSIQVSAIKRKGIVVKTLGSFHVFINDEEITQERWVSSKARDLLAYFITFRGERILVDRVFDALWRDTSGRGKTAFHTALSRLRKALRGEERTLKYILVESSEYWLDTARFDLDVDEFDAALVQTRTASSKDLAAQWYQRAIDLYNGEYLANLYYDWVFPEQRRLASSHLNALLSLSDIQASRGIYSQAIELLQETIKIDPYLEDAYCRLMKAYAKMNKRTEIIRHYQLLEQHLQDELGVPPMLSTQKLYKHLIQSA